MVELFERSSHVKAFHNDLRIYLEASCLHVKTLLVMNDHRFFAVLGHNQMFYIDVICPIVKELFGVIPSDLPKKL